MLLPWHLKEAAKDRKVHQCEYNYTDIIPRRLGKTLIKNERPYVVWFVGGFCLSVVLGIPIQGPVHSIAL